MGIGRLEIPIRMKDVVRDRGLSDGMWNLICAASDTIIAARPRFPAICGITEGLARDWSKQL